MKKISENDNFSDISTSLTSVSPVHMTGTYRGYMNVNVKSVWDVKSDTCRHHPAIKSSGCAFHRYEWVNTHRQRGDRQTGNDSVSELTSVALTERICHLISKKVYVYKGKKKSK